MMYDTYKERIPESKECPRCRCTKSSAEFGTKRYQPDGLNTHCKPCARVVYKELEAKKKQKGIKRRRTKRQAEYQKTWYEENKGRICVQRKEYMSTPSAQAKRSYRKAVRRALEKNSIPKWLTENQKEEIRLLYKQAKTLTEFHEEQYEVDHIEPLNGKTSVGLTVPWNLRVIHWADNRSKSNKLLLESINLN